ncbi:MAG: ferrochelatase [Calditrichia bacterium]
MHKTGVLLVNLGSPDSPGIPDVRKYLNEFLMDKNVIDAPYLIRRMIVSLFILPFRPKKSAHAYQSIWQPEGSPLIIYSRKVLEKVRQQCQLPVELGMRYGQPSIRDGILKLARQQVKEVLLIPLYPHYAMSTFGTVIEKTEEEIQKSQLNVQLRVIKPFYNHPEYLNALAKSLEPFLGKDYDHLLFSYHGIPLRHLKKTDPTGSHCLSSPDCCRVPSPAHQYCYRHQVFATTTQLAERLSLPAEKYSVSFQSRLGSDKWLTPFTDREIIRLAAEGKKKLMVICPAFVSDCLETLEEIGMRGREVFLENGGEEFTLIPCLNDQETWIEALVHFIENPLYLK